MGPIQKSQKPPVLMRAGRADWDDLKVFLMVAELKSFSAAAKALGLTQPTVSKRIDELEARLEAKLLERTSAGAQLTDIGLLISDHVRTMDRAALSIQHLAHQANSRDQGRVRVAAPDGIGAFWLAPQLAGFQAENPQISITLDAGLWSDLVDVEPCDITLQFIEERRLDAIAIELATFHYALFASPSYIETYGAPRTLAEVADHRTVHHLAQIQQRDNWDPKAGALQTLSAANFATNSSAAAMMAVMRGAGIGALPTCVVSFAPDLVMVSESPMARLRLWMVVGPKARKIARISRVMDWLIGLFDRRTNPWFEDDFIHPDELARWKTQSRT